MLFPLWFESLTLKVLLSKANGSFSDVAFKLKVPSFNTFAFITAKVPFPLTVEAEAGRVIAIFP